MIITLCGSARFEAAFHHWNERLTLDGHVVFGLAVYPSTKGEKLWYTEEQKVKLDKAHKRKIDASDAIFVVNMAGTRLDQLPQSMNYIGDSTRSEISHAFKANKQLWYAQSVLADERVSGRFPIPAAW